MRWDNERTFVLLWGQIVFAAGLLMFGWFLGWVYLTGGVDWFALLVTATALPWLALAIWMLWRSVPIEWVEIDAYARTFRFRRKGQTVSVRSQDVALIWPNTPLVEIHVGRGRVLQRRRYVISLHDDRLRSFLIAAAGQGVRISRYYGVPFWQDSEALDQPPAH